MSLSVRVGHAEREQALVRLKSAFSEGRLDETELDMRARHALEARTRADLDALLIDLPTPPADSAPDTSLLAVVSRAFFSCKCCCKSRR